MPQPPYDAPRPERRRPRRDAELTYTIRAELQDTEPPVWRRLAVSSHLMLDELHGVLQVAFGWTDSHLHTFAVGSSVWDPEAQQFLSHTDLEETDDDDPIAEVDVRLDEVLVATGDRLFYAYDYGDGWEADIVLESVVGDAPHDRARCTDGRRAGPPEDCGGPPGLQQLTDAGQIDDVFDLAVVNRSLARRGEDGP